MKNPCNPCQKNYEKVYATPSVLFCDAVQKEEQSVGDVYL